MHGQAEYFVHCSLITSPKFLTKKKLFSSQSSPQRFFTIDSEGSALSNLDPSGIRVGESHLFEILFQWRREREKIGRSILSLISTYSTARKQNSETANNPEED